jgi:hypothetical protein
VSDLVKRPTTTRASDADRDRVLQLLSEATSDGRLSVEEHHELMTQTLGAKTIGELEVITTDLSPHVDPAPEVHVVTHPMSRRGLLAIFGARTRKGGWQVPTEFHATAIFGAIELDFRDAKFDAPEVICVANSVFGAVEITVPDWVNVIDDGVAILGAREDAGPSSATPTVTLRLKGITAFGAVEVKRRAPTLHRGTRTELADPAGD